MSDRAQVKAFYDGAPEAEWARLEQNPWEFEINCRYIDRYVQPGQSVLDLGGGPGRYSIHLAERGCRVTLADLSDGNVALARKKAAEAGVELTAMQADALDGGTLPKGPFDHVLCMGPLYHLLKEEERRAAIANCLSRLRPGGVFFAAFISMYGDLLYRLGHMADWPEGIAEVDGNEVNRRYYGCLERGEDYAGESFTRAYFAQAGSAERHFEGFPLKKLHLVGSEGVLASREEFKNLPAEARAGWIELSLRLCEIPELLSWSEHLLYIGQKIQEDRI